MLKLNGRAAMILGMFFGVRPEPLVVTPQSMSLSRHHWIRSTKPFLMKGSPPENSMWYRPMKSLTDRSARFQSSISISGRYSFIRQNSQ